jgi:type I site-specific restriction endonuclease
MLDKYADDGIKNLENMSVLKVQPFDRIGTPLEIVKLFGGRNATFQQSKGLSSSITHWKPDSKTYAGLQNNFSGHFSYRFY